MTKRSATAGRLTNVNLLANPVVQWKGMIGPADLDSKVVRQISSKFGVTISYVENMICFYQNAFLDNANAKALWPRRATSRMRSAKPRAGLNE